MSAGVATAEATRWRRWLEEVAAAALFLQPFALLTALLLFIAPPDPAQFTAADPIVRSVAMTVGVFAIPAAALLALPVWLAMAWPGEAALRRAMRLAGAGVAAAVALPLLLRAVAGSTLPWFIPPEEGAAPGLSAGLAAGLGEEVLCRLAVLPAVLAVCRGRVAPMLANLLAVAVTGAVFAVAHQVGPGATEFAPAYVAVRFLVPGVLMSAAALRPGPTFICTAHCAAHLLLPLLFH